MVTRIVVMVTHIVVMVTHIVVMVTCIVVMVTLVVMATRVVVMVTRVTRIVVMVTRIVLMVMLVVMVTRSQIQYVSQIPEDNRMGRYEVKRPGPEDRITLLKHANLLNRLGKNTLITIMIALFTESKVEIILL